MNMTAKYYMAIRPQTNEHHAVHREDCPFLPEDEKRIYLGRFWSGADAIKEGQRHFARTTVCGFCSKEHHSEKHNSAHHEADINAILPTASQIAQYQEGRLFYLLN
jgi:formate dehydrogenase assembly factor FdhD